MSDNDAITRCPHCNTQFKVTADQLAAASGMVRCGSCLQVFQGVQQITHDRDAETAGGDLAPELSAADGVLSDDGRDQRHDSFSHAPPVYEGQPELAVQDEDLDTWAAQASATLEALASRNSGADDVDPRDAPYLLPGGAPERSDPFDDDIDIVLDAEPPWVNLAVASEAGGSDAPWRDDQWVPDSDVADEVLPGTGGIVVAPEDPQTIVGGLPQAPTTSRLPWILGALALAVVLIWQYAWYERGHWSQNENLRGYYERVCAVAGCQLPVYDNPAHLRINEVLVRTHPAQADALQIDAIIRNNAAFPQVFPDLDLVFTNVNNRIVARRTFAPREYLAGELQGTQHIPARTEVRIAIEIVDPGDAAPGFALTLHRQS